MWVLLHVPESSIRCESDVTLAGRARTGGVKTVRVYVTLAKTGLRLRRTYLGCMLDRDGCVVLCCLLRSMIVDMN